jgi:hypothetical protein
VGLKRNLKEIAMESKKALLDSYVYKQNRVPLSYNYSIFHGD